MRRSRPASLLAALVVAAVALCGMPGAAHARTWSVPASVATKDAQEVTNDDLEDALMVEINAARAAEGLSKIWTFDSCTDRLAELWGARIARTGRFEHRNQNEIIRRCNNSWAGETLVRGSGLTPADMVELWLDSPPHREILLNPRAKRAGVAITEDSQGRVIGVVNLVRQN
ncbi:CAP domain-containing protein [Nocardioides hwasunensis]|uniref:CAP domain-containing protein n=1 Tax=Nocardioides hwasunensis TaxID=397258 RepID=A0ABR8MF49_9ACTN|nr:CAP domain-containing protein [Nocardioides hwasunensis]MBD3913701.1 CAP domain-containing protein [Nocardioides hwasunensis]